MNFLYLFTCVVVLASHIVISVPVPTVENIESTIKPLSIIRGGEYSQKGFNTSSYMPFGISLNIIACQDFHPFNPFHPNRDHNGYTLAYTLFLYLHFIDIIDNSVSFDYKVLFHAQQSQVDHFFYIFQLWHIEA